MILTATSLRVLCDWCETGRRSSFASKLATDQLQVIFAVCRMPYACEHSLKGLAQAKIIKKSMILFRVLNMTI